MKTFKQWLAEKYSSFGIYNYQRKVSAYKNYLGNEGIGTMLPEILSYIGDLRKRDLHPKTVKHHLSAIKIYYYYLQQTGQRKDHPCKKLKLKDQINRSIQLESLYTMDQMEQFLKEHKTKQSFLQRRDEVMISLLIYQAPTSTELINITTEDIDLENGEIRIRALEGGSKNTNKSRTLALRSKQILLIDRYLSQDRPGLVSRNRNPSPEDEQALLLTKYGKKIERQAIRRQINHGHEKFMRMTPFKMRQSVIHHKLKEGHNVRVVQVFAGHRSILSTEEYQTSQLEELKVGINKYHPLQ